MPSNSSAAIAFGYFETVIRKRSLAQIQTELNRLMGLNKYIEETSGIDPYIFEDMTEETFCLLKRIAHLHPFQEEAMKALLSAFKHSRDKAIRSFIIFGCSRAPS